MFFTNRSKKVSDGQIRKLLSLLNKEIQEIEGFIHVYEHLGQIPHDLSKDEEIFKKIQKGIMKGAFWRDIKRIMLFNFNIFRNDEYANLNFVFILYHEIRHLYQYHFLNEQYTKEEKRNKQEDIRYEDTWAEVDADYYASVWMLQNKEEILDIIGETYDFTNDLQKQINRYEKYQKQNVA